ncbi:MAG TPA: hypothetical protein VK324_05235, partial [Tepidisphaeraceae bacterium]|nr:hypothetical protein [Tepidisphaeraceae bacterium]
CEPLEPRRLLTANVWIDDWDTPASAPEGGGVSFTVMAFDADETAFTSDPDDTTWRGGLAWHAPVDVAYTVGGSAGSGDHGASGGTFTIESWPRQAQGSHQVTIPFARDNVIDPGETVAFTLSAGSGYAIAGPPHPEGPGQRTFTIADDPPVVSIEKLLDGAEDPTGSAAGTGPTPVKFKLSRSGGDPSMPLTAKVKLAGTATPSTDHDRPADNEYAITGASAEFSVTPVDDNESDGDDGVGTETVVATIEPDGDKYKVADGGGTATATIADDAAWYFSPWRISTDKPDTWKTANHYLGMREYIVQPNMLDKYKYVEHWNYFDQWVPVYSLREDTRFGPDTATFESTFYFESQSSWSFGVGGSVELTGGSTTDFQLLSYTTTQTAGTSKTNSFSTTAPAHEKHMIVPLIKNRTMFKTQAVYKDLNNGAGQPQWHQIENHDYVPVDSGYFKQFDQVVFAYNREWKDQDSTILPGWSLTEPPDDTSIYDSLIPG